MKSLFIAILTFSTLLISAQESDTLSVIIDPIETEPIFPGGNDSLCCFIETNLNFKILNSTDKTGKIIVFFNIDTTGQVLDIEINPELLQKLSGVINDRIIENEIKRVIQLMPRWKPATQRNKAIKVQYALPIRIPYTDFKCKNL